MTELRYALDESRDLKGPLVAAALVLMVLDTLAVFWMGGLFSRRPRIRRARAGASVAALLIALGVSRVSPETSRAQDAKPGDAEAMEAISTTRLAYVLTGDAGVDSISRAGLSGLSRFLIEKTALEPGEPAGVDIAKDELSFYPIIYWPIDANAAMPSEAAIARIDAYMQAGGTVLFDTRDQFSTGIDAGSASPATERLRDILGNLNVPPLEPVPCRPRADQVLLHPSGVSRPLQRQPALGRGVAGGAEPRKPAGPHRRRRHPDHDHRQRFRRRLGDRRERRPAAADRAVRPDAARSMRCAPASTS